MLVPTGCGQQDKTALPEVQSEQTASSKLNPSEPVIDGENKVYTLGGIEIPLPLEHLGKMIVITDFPKERSDGETLLETYEKASVEALNKTSSSEDGGFLFGFNVMNQAQFEQLLANDVGGCSVFARKGDNYYAKTYPTDVQYFRENGKIDFESEDWQTWETLNALGDDVCEAIIERNDLTPYSQWEFYDQPFTWEGQHAYIEYYPDDTCDSSKTEFYTFILSQPIQQGEGGLWCVERMYDEYGTSYLLFPDSGIPAANYYKKLQTECDAGQHQELLTPLGAAAEFVQSSKWFDGKPVKNSFVFTNELENKYIVENQRIQKLIPRLLSGRDIEDMEFLDCIEGFHADTWSVMEHNFYGYDWWTPLQDALEDVSVGVNQAKRDRIMMNFFLASYGQYERFIAGYLRAQREADPNIFDTVLDEFSNEQKSSLITAVKPSIWLTYH